MAEMTGGELLLKCLKAEGATTLFGVLDGSYNAFLAKLNDYEIKYIAPRHEAAAAHIAEAWARVKGEPAVVVGGIGPGAANMISGVITAYAEGTPLIVLSGQRRRSTIYPDRGGGFQNVDLLGLFRPVTKFCAGVRDFKRMPELIRRAYREATTGRPGPVYIEIPEDIMRGKGDSDSITVTLPTQHRTRVGAGDADSVARAADLLAKAERPFLHAGKGVSWSGAWKEFVELGDHLSAALGTSLGARGVVPEDHPRCFTPMNRTGLAAARSDADVVLVVGSRLGELDNWGRGATWGDPSKQKVIHIDCDPLSIGLNRPVDVGIVGDAKATLSALLIAVKQKTSQRKEHANFEKYREASKMWESQKEQALQLGMGGINSGAMIKVVRDFFPREAIHAMDGGNTSLWASAFNAVYEPRSYLYTAHFGHLGAGLPYAIGAKVAAPDRAVYLITGDGALGFNIQELETAARHNIPIIVIVACDKGWGMERSSQLFAQVGAMVETELYAESRYDQIAVAFGCHGEKVDQLDQLKSALERATASGKPALIQVMVDQMANMAPPGLVDFGAMVYRADD
jgi:acetolactate synthase-1/2/3 large subunit